jgi:large subunit ribosomal protein L15
MQINTLKLKYPKKKRKTIGRGGKKGTYSGKGGKGQKGRSGVSINPLFEGGRSSLIDRLKKVRGFKSYRLKPLVFTEGDIIDREVLLKKGLLRKKNAKRRIKILEGASVKSKFKIRDDVMVSSSAKKAVPKPEAKEKSKAGPKKK